MSGQMCSVCKGAGATIELKMRTMPAFKEGSPDWSIQEEVSTPCFHCHGTGWLYGQSQ